MASISRVGNLWKTTNHTSKDYSADCIQFLRCVLDLVILACSQLCEIGIVMEARWLNAF